MVDETEKERMKALEDRIAAAKAKQTPKPKPTEDAHSNAELGWRMVIELVAGLVIGFWIGYGLDAVFGTIPIFLVIFTMLGFVAGVKTMLRSAQEFQNRGRDGEDASRDDDERT
ncbi:ATP synthase protein I [Tranquillimonas rosea]|uniref:ATP synthase protein I n=1 Tax=Tranquillimonas rosea TaxID=641238 RepID=A0A1H9QZB5_9RHOB|nr:AtpZ/AtpI family protein [Tranquillimonas rosea]SER65800.1 ATP synthase protein I [Tranquillimonas rosea]